jgi:hypothetical protein
MMAAVAGRPPFFFRRAVVDPLRAATRNTERSAPPRSSKQMKLFAFGDARCGGVARLSRKARGKPGVFSRGFVAAPDA